MLLACVQTDIHIGNISKNLQTVHESIDSAAANGADLVVFPECMLTGYGFDTREEAMVHARSLEDGIFRELQDHLAEKNIFITLGFLEVEHSSDSRAPRLFNASALLGPEGMIGHYRKVHLPHLGVDRFVDRGDMPYAVLSAGDAKIGLAICYDCSFPEPMRVLALQGADIIALGTNWPIAASRTAEIVPSARSMENHLFFVAANRAGTERGFRFCGLSSICGPDGVVLAQSKDDQETILYAEVNLAQARNKRIERTPGAHVIDRFADRCPSFYRGLDQDR
jgi:5-aminopentanamidase